MKIWILPISWLSSWLGKSECSSLAFPSIGDDRYPQLLQLAPRCQVSPAPRASSPVPVVIGAVTRAPWLSMATMALGHSIPHWHLSSKVRWCLWKITIFHGYLRPFIMFNGYVSFPSGNSLRLVKKNMAIEIVDLLYLWTAVIIHTLNYRRAYRNG